MENMPPEAPKFNVPQVEPPQPEKIPDAPLPSEVKEFKPHRSKKKIITILLLILAVITGAVAVWYFVLKDTKEHQAQSQVQEQPAGTEIIQLGEPDTVPYVFMAGDAAFYSLFWRDSDGGDRTEVGPLATGSYVSQSAVSGQNVAYAVENAADGTGAIAVWLSHDAGKNYEQIMKLDAGDQVTSMVFSTDSKSLAVAVLKNNAASNKVSLLDTDSGQEVGSYTSEQRGVFIVGYNAQKSEIAYYEGCYNCDSSPYTKLTMRNVSNNTVKVIADAGDSIFTHTAIRSDFAEVLVSRGTVQATGNEVGLSVSAPYTIQKIAPDGDTKENIGEVTDEAVISVGYRVDGETPYYAYGNKVVSPGENNELVTLYESDAALLRVFYVSKQRVIASSGSSEDFILHNYDIETNSPTVILSGDNNTTLFGVTTK